MQWTQSFAFSEFYSNQAKSEIYLKMLMFEQLKKQVPVNPSLERSWYERFGIIKAHGQKNQPPIQLWGVAGALPTMYFQKMQFLGVFRPFLQRSLDYATQFLDNFT